MTDEKKPVKIEFAPGALDNFDGTQEELDELIAEIHRMIETGELFENSRPLDPEEDADIIEYLESNPDLTDKRTLQ